MNAQVLEGCAPSKGMWGFRVFVLNVWQCVHNANATGRPVCQE